VLLLLYKEIMPISAKFRAAQKSAMAVKKGRRYTKTVITRSLPQSTVSQQVATALARRSENKYVDYPWASVVLNNPGMATNDYIYCINPMQAGAAYFNRIGRKTKTLSIRVKLHLVHKFSNDFTIPYSTGVLGNTLRIAIIYDRENTGVIPPFNSFFGTTDQGGAQTTQMSDPLKLQVSDRYRVLADEIMTFEPHATPVLGDYDPITGNSTATYTNYAFKTWDRFIDCSKKQINQQYQSTSNPATVADLSSGAIYVIFKPNLYSAATNSLTIVEGLARTKVSDN